MKLEARTLYAWIAVVSFGLIGGALFLQHAVGLAPCPLCIFQRIAYFAAGVFALLAAWRAPRRGTRLFGSMVFVSTLVGASIAARHVWLQMNPQGGSCGPGLESMLENFPLTSVLPMVLRGSGDCSEAAWTLLGLTIAEWSLIWFLILAVAAGLLLLARRFQSSPRRY